MKLKALAAVRCCYPLMVACGPLMRQQRFKRNHLALNGAGATFPAPLYNCWFQSFNKETGNQVNYQAVGSGAGVRQYTAKTVDFGASDGAVSDAKQKLPKVWFTFP